MDYYSCRRLLLLLLFWRMYYIILYSYDRSRHSVFFSGFSEIGSCDGDGRIAIIDPPRMAKLFGHQSFRATHPRRRPSTRVKSSEKFSSQTYCTQILYYLCHTKNCCSPRPPLNLYMIPNIP